MRALAFRSVLPCSAVATQQFDAAASHCTCSEHLNSLVSLPDPIEVTGTSNIRKACSSQSGSFCAAWRGPAAVPKQAGMCCCSSSHCR